MRKLLTERRFLIGSPASPGGTLAHAFLPRRGEAHFDRAERWSLGGHKGHNLFLVAAHEVGHTLGLQHSPVRHALMSPYYRRRSRRHLLLSWDDVVAVQQLYGEKATPNSPPPPPYCRVCDSNILGYHI